MGARRHGRPGLSLPYIGEVPTDPGLVLALTTTRAALQGAEETVVLRTAGQEWELHHSVRPAPKALVSGAHLTFGDLAPEAYSRAMATAAAPSKNTSTLPGAPPVTATVEHPAGHYGREPEASRERVTTRFTPCRRRGGFRMHGCPARSAGDQGSIPQRRSARRSHPT